MRDLSQYPAGCCEVLGSTRRSAGSPCVVASVDDGLLKGGFAKWRIDDTERNISGE